MHTVIPYMEYFKKRSWKDVFVLTDDYTIIEQLLRYYGDYCFYTFCTPVERGYFHRSFSRIGRNERCEQLLRLFASVDIMSRSALFLGTTTSNPSIFMNLIRPEISKSVDSDQNMIYLYFNR